MASSLPNDIFHNVFQRFAYNIDLIEKRFANKRPSGLELDVDTGKIIQVVDAKRPRLTVEEAKEKMKKTFLAPSSLLGNSTLSSPFVHDMTAPREIKKRVLKHNKRFQQQVSNGIDCSSFLDDENRNNEESYYEENDENQEAEELFDLSEFIGGNDENDNEDDEQDNEEDTEDKEEDEELVGDELLESEEDVGPEDEEGQDLEEELDNQKEDDEDVPFEEPEDEAANEDNTYKNIRITRALIQRLTPKAIRAKKATATAASKKKSTPLLDGTPKAVRGRKSMPSTSKKQNFESTPVAKRGRKSMPSSSKKQSVESTPVTKRGRKSMPSAAKKMDVESTAVDDDDAPKKPRGRPRKSKAVEEVTAATALKKKSTPLIDGTPKATRGRKSMPSASKKQNVESTPVAKRGRKSMPSASKKQNVQSSVDDAAPKKPRGRPRKSNIF